MNLFVLNLDPFVAARENCDKHIVKIPLEAAEMLGYTYIEKGTFFEPTPQINNIDLFPFKMHYNHPMSCWVRESQSNFGWTLNHLRGLLDEYTFRYGKKHSIEKSYNWVVKNKLIFDEINKTEMPRCFGDFKSQIPTTQDVAKDYQKYYCIAKKGFVKWTKREIPKWWIQQVN